MCVITPEASRARLRKGPTVDEPPAARPTTRAANTAVAPLTALLGPWKQMLLLLNTAAPAQWRLTPGEPRVCSETMLRVGSMLSSIIALKLNPSVKCSLKGPLLCNNDESSRIVAVNVNCYYSENVNEVCSKRFECRFCFV